jgi:hypothetical protein
MPLERALGSFWGDPNGLFKMFDRFARSIGFAS